MAAFNCGVKFVDYMFTTSVYSHPLPKAVLSKIKPVFDRLSNQKLLDARVEN